MTTTGFQFSERAIGLQPLRCSRCLAKGHNCYTDRLDENKQPICVFCEDGEPCFWEQHNKNSRPSVAPAPKPQLITRKETSMPAAQPAPAKVNGHTPTIAERLCKCGCGENVPPFQRFAYIKGHMKRGEGKKVAKIATKEKCACGRPLGHTGRHVGGVKPATGTTVANNPSAAPPVAARVSLAVTEAQLNLFLVRLSIEEKQRLANYFLETAEG